MQALALLAVALMAETDGDETSNSVDWAMVVLAAGYVVVALMALALNWGTRTKVSQGGDQYRSELSRTLYALFLC